jgi:hypothetical protein
MATYGPRRKHAFHTALREMDFVPFGDYPCTSHDPEPGLWYAGVHASYMRRYESGTVGRAPWYRPGRPWFAKAQKEEYAVIRWVSAGPPEVTPGRAWLRHKSRKGTLTQMTRMYLDVTTNLLHQYCLGTLGTDRYRTVRLRYTVASVRYTRPAGTTGVPNGYQQLPAGHVPRHGTCMIHTWWQQGAHKAHQRCPPGPHLMDGCARLRTLAQHSTVLRGHEVLCHKPLSGALAVRCRRRRCPPCASSLLAPSSPSPVAKWTCPQWRSRGPPSWWLSVQQPLSPEAQGLQRAEGWRGVPVLPQGVEIII